MDSHPSFKRTSFGGGPIGGLFAEQEHTLSRFPVGSQPVATSEDAAAQVQSRVGAARLRVLRILYAVSNPAGEGWTADEVAVLLDAQSNQVAPRLTELMGMGYVERLTIKRATRLGSLAYAHALTKKGREFMAHA